MITEEEKEIIETLKHTLGYDAPHITQEQFDNIVDYMMKNETEYWLIQGMHITHQN